MKNLITSILSVLLCMQASAQQSWFTVASSTDRDLRTIQFVDEHTGYIGGDSVLLKTTDGGASWSEMPLDSIPLIPNWDLDIRDMHWFTADHGIVMAGPWGGAFETFDGGQDWSSMEFANFGFCQTTSVFFFDENTGFAGGGGCFQGSIIDRFNNGTWNTAQLPLDMDVPNWVSSIEFRDANFGLAGTAKGTLLRTTNGGIDWDSIPNVAGDSAITDFVFRTDGSIGATHRNNSGFGIMISTDDGLTWETDWTNATFFYPQLNAAHLDEVGTEYMAGNESNTGGGLIFENSAGFWYSSTFEKTINDLASYGDSIVFAVGDSGQIHVNTDLGAVGIRDKEEVNFSLHPNPVTDRIQIALPTEPVKRYIVTDVSGRTIWDKTLTSSTTVTSIDVSKLSAGSYLLTVETESGVGTRQFLKE